MMPQPLDCGKIPKVATQAERQYVKDSNLFSVAVTYLGKKTKPSLIDKSLRDCLAVASQ